MRIQKPVQRSFEISGAGFVAESPEKLGRLSRAFPADAQYSAFRDAQVYGGDVMGLFMGPVMGLAPFEQFPGFPRSGGEMRGETDQKVTAILVGFENRSGLSLESTV